MNKNHPKYILLFLSLFFTAYSFHIYTMDVFNPPGINRDLTAAGRMVWQKNNCQACHQLYGLGGYLGPDLSNVVSAPGKGDQYIAAYLRAGSARMPAFQLSKKELHALTAFLHTVDAYGNADPSAYQVNSLGMISNPPTHDQR